jgi:dTMP kinase
LSIFINLEGIEGTGKSTQSRRLAKRLRDAGYACVLTREPGATAIGKQIRQIVLSPENHRLCAEAELGLYFSDRAQHLREIVWPALAAGRIVVTDRFTDSTLAYQGYGRRLPISMIRSLDRIMTGSFRPHVTLLLDLPVEEGLRRARRRNKNSPKHRREGRFEEEELAFHERVRRGYGKMAKREPNRFVTVSAMGTASEVHEALWRALKATGKLPRR